MTIPAGEFWLGSEQRREEEKPLHRLYLPEYQISRTPITNAQYQLFVQATSSRQPNHWPDGRPPRGEESHPVINVTWHEALIYCRWLSEMTGKTITLPSEAEWEKAARGDQDKREYPWGDEWNETKCNNSELELGGTTPVGIFPEGASPYGVLDMAGNVWEWTRSLWGKSYSSPDFKYPYHPADGREDLKAGDVARRVLRGGSFYDERNYVRCAARVRYLPSYRSRYDGFRLVVSPISPSAL